ncbi:MAG: hypothetical protein CL878_02775 [Dehalococcoidia bacterium]|nr:hypothetical protein [Dehalococcoidia bacterium]
MLFVTNRFPKQGIETRIGRPFEFELNDNAAGNSMFFCERTDREVYREIGSVDLLQRLKESSYRQLLIYIHGFSNLPEHAFATARNLQNLCDARQSEEVLVVPAIWPCDNDVGLVGDYWDDQKAADQSAFAFARLLGKFLEWRSSEEHNPQSNPCLKRINVLAHSMGNRVLRETLAAWSKYDLPGGLPLIFRNTFLVAADIVNESLHIGERGEAICRASRNVVVYYASDDLALRASKAANLKNNIASRRLGHTGPENMQLTPRNVYAVDCDDVNTSYDNPTGHSYFGFGVEGRPGRVFEHIFSTIERGRVFPDAADEFRRTAIIRE